MGLNNVQACYKHYEKLELEELNNNVNISDEVIEHLRRNWLWMSNYSKIYNYADN